MRLASDSETGLSLPQWEPSTATPADVCVLSSSEYGNLLDHGQRSLSGHPEFYPHRPVTTGWEVPGGPDSQLSAYEAFHGCRPA